MDVQVTPNKSMAGADGVESTAYALMLDVAAAEGKSTRHYNTGGEMADRVWLSRTYVHCLKMVLRARKDAGYSE